MAIALFQWGVGVILQRRKQMGKKYPQDDPAWQECKRILEKDRTVTDIDNIYENTWKRIVNEYQHLIGKKFIKKKGYFILSLVLFTGKMIIIMVCVKMMIIVPFCCHVLVD